MNYYKHVRVVSLYLFTVTATSPVLAQFTKPQKEHDWLQQMVGQWETDSEYAVGGETRKDKGTANIRSIGGLWVQAELDGSLFGQPVKSIYTLGYDPEKQIFVGTWIDSMTTSLSMFEGLVDDSGKILTLETEAPSPFEKDKTTTFRQVIEIKDKNHQTLTAGLLGPEQKWVTVITIEYRRKK